MILEIDGQELDLAVFLGEDYKAIRYEMTSTKTIEPKVAAYCLFLLVKSMCVEADVSVERLISLYGPDESADKKITH